MAIGATLVTLAGAPAATIGSIAVMGTGGGLVLATVQAGLAEHHGDRRAVALTEANVAAAASYLPLAGALLLAGRLGLGWRAALLTSLAVPAVVWLTSRRTRMEPVRSATAPSRGRLPKVLWVAGAMLMCATAAEWCVAAWGATFAQQALHSTPDAAVAVMAGYFAGVLGGRQTTAASGRVVLMTSVAILLAPFTVGTLADATSLTSALVTIPVLIALAVVALGMVLRVRPVARLE